MTCRYEKITEPLLQETERYSDKGCIVVVEKEICHIVGWSNEMIFQIAQKP